MTTRAARCPTCKAAVAAAAPRPAWFPFCSRRCQLVDLGRWLDEDYRVSEPAGTSDETPPGERE